MKRLILGIASTLLLVTGFALPAATAAAATPGQLGGLDLASYCQNHGDDGTTATGPVVLMLGGVTGTNYAYNNWACVTNAGTNVPFTIGGGFPSFVDACTSTYTGVASYPYPSDPDNAYTWNCYSQQPSSGPGHNAQVADVVSTLVSTDPIQAEIAVLQPEASQTEQVCKTVHNKQHCKTENMAKVDLRAFMAQKSTRELITDVVEGYHLQGGVPPVTIGLHKAILTAIGL
jgi:hypothetical protein